MWCDHEIEEVMINAAKRYYSEHEETLPKIGSAFGGKDHITVMHSVDKIKKEILTNKDLETEIKNIISKIK